MVTSLGITSIMCSATPNLHDAGEESQGDDYGRKPLHHSVWSRLSARMRVERGGRGTTKVKSGQPAIRRYMPA